MGDQERIPFVGGPLDGQTYAWTTSNAVLVPDAADMLTVYSPKWDETRTLFGEHRYEMRCYANGDERRYQLEHVSYTEPKVPAGCKEVGRMMRSRR